MYSLVPPWGSEARNQAELGTENPSVQQGMLCSDGKCVCILDDKNLPNVPPLQLSVPADYPDQSPLWIKNPRQYGMRMLA